jgi:uncharacterized protein (UPF0335 family)
MASEAERFSAVREKVKTLSDRKIRLEERHKAETLKLETLLKEIVAKGYDPKKLTEIRKEKQDQLAAQLKELEAGVESAEKQLNEIEVA